jgi:putative transposase
MEQMARNVTDESTGCLRDIRFVLHDRDTKFCASFESILTASRVKTLNAAGTQSESEFARRTLGALSETGMLAEADSFRRRLFEARTYRVCRAFSRHQGKGNVLLFPTEGPHRTAGAQIACKQRLSGLAHASRSE